MTLPLWRTLELDLAKHEPAPSTSRILRAILFKRTFRPVASLRLCQSAQALSQPLRGVLLTLARLFHHWACGQAVIDLPWQTRIGAGFRIRHGYGLVVNQHAIIGSDVTVFHGVTIGQRNVTRDGVKTPLYPTVGDGVFLFPHAMVLGAHVGNGSIVAAMTVVHKDIPAGHMVTGNPMEYRPINGHGLADHDQIWEYRSIDRHAPSDHDQI